MGVWFETVYFMIYHLEDMMKQATMSACTIVIDILWIPHRFLDLTCFIFQMILEIFSLDSLDKYCDKYIKIHQLARFYCSFLSDMYDGKWEINLIMLETLWVCNHSNIAMFVLPLKLILSASPYTNICLSWPRLDVGGDTPPCDSFTTLEITWRCGYSWYWHIFWMKLTLIASGPVYSIGWVRSISWLLTPSGLFYFKEVDPTLAKLPWISMVV